MAYSIPSSSSSVGDSRASTFSFALLPPSTIFHPHRPPSIGSSQFSTFPLPSTIPPLLAPVATLPQGRNLTPPPPAILWPICGPLATPFPLSPIPNARILSLSLALPLAFPIGHSLILCCLLPSFFSFPFPFSSNEFLDARPRGRIPSAPSHFSLVHTPQFHT